MNEIKVGDVVQLKSGGPRMTVSKLQVWNGVLEALCEWFEEKKDQNQRASFPVTSLKVWEE